MIEEVINFVPGKISIAEVNRLQKQLITNSYLQLKKADRSYDHIRIRHDNLDLGESYLLEKHSPPNSMRNINMFRDNLCCRLSGNYIFITQIRIQ